VTIPLTPPDCDLTDFPFMPLMVERLRRSKAWLICKRNPALAFYMVNLWTASWHDKPAGSLEDDDDVLADLAMCDPGKWAKLKADVMRGWVMCDDGRWYHPVVAERAREAWESKQDQRWRTECGRIKKHNDRHGTKIPRPTFDEWVSSGCPQGQRLPVPRDTAGTEVGHDGETGSKREGEREGQGDSSSEANASGAADAPPPPKPKVTDPDEIIFGYGVPLLTVAGSTDKHARSFLAMLRKDHGDAAVVDKLRECIKAKPLQPLEWLAKALPPKGNGAAGKHAGFETKDYREGVEADGTLA